MIVTKDCERVYVKTVQSIYSLANQTSTNIALLLQTILYKLISSSEISHKCYTKTCLLKKKNKNNIMTKIVNANFILRSCLSQIMQNFLLSNHTKIACKFVLCKFVLQLFVIQIIYYISIFPMFYKLHWEFLPSHLNLLTKLIF